MHAKRRFATGSSPRGDSCTWRYLRREISTPVVLAEALVLGHDFPVSSRDLARSGAISRGPPDLEIAGDRGRSREVRAGRNTMSERAQREV